MDENKTGQFIAQLRKEKKITQKDLAAQLHITDKAVSKWERGVSYPDITLLTSLADILGVTTSELLNGQRSEAAVSEDIEKTVGNALAYAEKTAKRKIASFQNVLSLSFSIGLLMGIIVCSICDLAISGAFTWSLYPISSILFVWLVFAPFIKYGRKGILGSLTVFSVLIIPFLYVISKIVDNNFIMPLGIRISLASVVYLWCVYLIFRKLKERKILAAAFSLLFTIPLYFLINFIVAKILSIPFFDIWDMVSLAIIIMGAIALWMIDSFKRRKKPITQTAREYS